MTFGGRAQRPLSSPPHGAAMQAEAQGYARRGWTVFPLQGKQPLVPWRDATPASAFDWTGATGIGLALGAVSGVVRIDCDGRQAADEFVKLCSGSPDSSFFTTPGGGFGWLYTYSGEPTQVLWKGPGPHEEVRYMSDGSYTVLPPSIHPNGGSYAWQADVAPKPLPVAVTSLLRSRRAAQILVELEREIAPTVGTPDRPIILEALSHLDPRRADDRDSWIQVGLALHSAGDEYLDDWIRWSSTSAKFVPGECETLWPRFHRSGRTTVRSLLHWAKEDGWKPPRFHEPLTDVGNGRVLARAGEGKLRYCRPWRKWLWWDSSRWNVDGELEVIALTKSLVRGRYDRAMKSLHRIIDDSDVSKQKLKSISRVLSWCAKSEEALHIHACLDMAESEPGIAVDVLDLNSHPHLLNCVNGTLDLRTGVLGPHDPSHMLTQLCPTAFDPAASAPRWNQFLSEVLPDPSIREFLQKFMGTCLSGDVSVQVMPVCWGSGCNGKSTLILALHSVLGEDYAIKAKRDFLVSKRGAEHPTSIARLYGRRFAACVESSEDGRLDETMVKELTGGDRIAARRMREDEWEFEATHKLVLVTNHLPEIRGTDDAIWRRLPLVPFTVSFLGREDPTLGAALAAEASGILNWMYDGYKLWGGRPLQRPQAVAAATDVYRSSQDCLGSFLNDRCRLDPSVRVRTEQFTAAYTVWCTQNRAPQLSKMRLAAALDVRGLHLDGTRKYRIGVEVLPQ